MVLAEPEFRGDNYKKRNKNKKKRRKNQKRAKKNKKKSKNSKRKNKNNKKNIKNNKKKTKNNKNKTKTGKRAMSRQNNACATNMNTYLYYLAKTVTNFDKQLKRAAVQTKLVDLSISPILLKRRFYAQ